VVNRPTARAHSEVVTGNGPVTSLTDPILAAKTAGLRYVNDHMPGIRRKRAGKGFVYSTEDGKMLHDLEHIRRIKSLALPPAWADVWICPLVDGHIQATARDAKGRKQYRYHARWREIRDETKYDRMITFGLVLPAVRRKIEEDFALPGLPREKILATVVRLLETTLIRVGNEEYARHNGSFGLTTMRDHHVDVSGSTIRFEFRGKSGRQHSVDLRDRRLARIIKRIQELPGEELFQYIDEAGQRHALGSADVNDYLREITGADFTAKDFRTWAGTVLAAKALQGLADWDSKAQAKRNVVQAVESVAKRLGNTKAICRKCYIHPAILNTYLDGSLLEKLRPHLHDDATGSLDDLRPEEAAVLGLLQARMKHDAQTRNMEAGKRKHRPGLHGLLKQSISRTRTAKRRTSLTATS
jgi:DNA topoisomerase-1